MGDRLEAYAAWFRWPAGLLWCCGAFCILQPVWDSWGRLRISSLNNRPMELAGFGGSLTILKCRRYQFHLLGLVVILA